MNKPIVPCYETYVKCIKVGDLGDRFTFGNNYELQIGNTLIDNYGDPFFIGTDNNYKFEAVE